ncbi:transposase [Streptomyces sp. NPDC008121]|uniref:transposase n=1 Tax=Streptomyces sp. NPDC008121 TaxID=3364809 RepID=UPI0036EC81E6
MTLGAGFIAATGGDMSVFASSGRLASVAGLAPVPRDSGKVRRSDGSAAAVRSGTTVS